MKLNFGFKLAILWVIIIHCMMFFLYHRTEISDDEKNFPYISAKTWAVPKERSFLDYSSYWDGNWYVSIAKNGYTLNPGKESNIVFFPLYPITIIIAKTITTLPWKVAGSLVSIIALILASKILYKEIREQWGGSIARRSLFYMLIFPSAFFFSVIYTESLFILLTVLCFYYLRKEKWCLVGLFAALATLTKTIGIILLPIIVLGYLLKYHKIKTSILYLVLPIIALGAWMIYCQYQFGDFLIFAHGQEAFHRPVGRFKLIELLQGSSTADKKIWIIDSLSALLAFTTGIILLVWKKFTYGLYVILGTLIPMASGTWQSMNRYVLVLFPMFIVLAIFSKRYIWLHYFYILVMPMLLAMHIIQFVHFAWAG